MANTEATLEAERGASHVARSSVAEHTVKMSSLKVKLNERTLLRTNAEQERDHAQNAMEESNADYQRRLAADKAKAAAPVDAPKKAAKKKAGKIDSL